MAQGIVRQIVLAKQSGLGVPATTGGRIRRRRTGGFKLDRDSYENDEITSDQQSRGVTLGAKKPSGHIDGLLSPLTWDEEFAAVLRKAFAATTPAATLSLTIAGIGPTWTVTRAAGSWLTDGFKIRDVIRLSVGALNAANIAKNLFIIGLNATVATVIVVNGSALVAEGPIASCTATVIGKKTLAPLTGHTNDYFTANDWYPDVPSCETYPDVKVGPLQLAAPASGNVTLGVDYVALNRAPLGTVQTIVSPLAETTNPVCAGVCGVLTVGSALQRYTGLQLTIDPLITQGENEAGSDSSSDFNRGKIKVSGTITAKFSNTVIQLLYDGQTPVGIGAVLPDSTLAAADFVALSMGRVKFTGDAPDDGEKEIVRTYPFTAEIDIAGGAALATDKTILSIQDSQAA